MIVMYGAAESDDSDSVRCAASSLACSGCPFSSLILQLSGWSYFYVSCISPLLSSSVAF